MNDEIQLQKIITLFDNYEKKIQTAPPDIKPNKNKLTKQIRQYFLNTIFNINNPFFLNISYDKIKYAKKFLNRYNFYSPAIINAYIKLHTVKNRLKLTENNIDDLFAAIVIKAYKNKYKSLQLFKALLNTIYILEKHTGVKFLINYNIQNFIYKISLKFHK